MPDVQRTVSILFSAEDKMSSALKNIGSSLDTFGGVASKIAGPLDQAGKTLIAFNSALTAMAVGGLVVAFNDATKFESAVADLQKVLGDNVDGLELSKQKAFEFSEQYGISSVEIIKSTADFTQAGYNLEDAMLLVKNSMDLVIAGGLDAAQSSDLLIASLKGFDAPASETAKLLAIINEVSNNYATDAEQLAIAMSKISPIAKQMGFDMAETAGLVTPIIEIFRSGDEAATSLKTGLLKLIDDSKPVADALEKIGVKQKDANGNLRAGKDILTDVATAFQTAEKSEKLFLTAQLVGTDQSARLVTVFDNLAKMTEITAVATQDLESATKEVAIRLQTAEVAVNKYQVSFENLMIVMGTQFLKSSKGVIQGATEINAALRNAISEDKLKPLFDLLNEAGESLRLFFTGIAKSLPDALDGVNFDGLIDALKGLGVEFGNLFGGIDLTTTDGLRDAIQSIVDFIAGTINVTSGMVEQVKPIFDILKAAFNEFNSLDVDSQKGIGKLLTVAMEIVALGPQITGVLLILKETSLDVQRVWDVVAGSIKFAWNQMQVAFDQLALTSANAVLRMLEVAGAVQIPFTDVDEKIRNARDRVKDFAEAIKETQYENQKEAIDGLAKAFGGVEEKTGNANKKIKETKQELYDWSQDPEWKKLEIQIGLETKQAKLDAEEAKKTVDEEFKHIDGYVYTDADLDSLYGTSKKIKQEVEKTDLKLQLEFDKLGIEKLKIESENLKSAFEWKAKLDIAQVEAATKQIESSFNSINEGISSTGDVISSIFKEFNDADFQSRWDMRDQLEIENKLRQQEFEMQKQLIDAQTRFLELKADALESGEGYIQIQADGLEPELEAFMWKIVQKVQIRGVEDQSEFLLGIT